MSRPFLAVKHTENMAKHCGREQIQTTDSTKSSPVEHIDFHLRSDGNQDEELTREKGIDRLRFVINQQCTVTE